MSPRQTFDIAPPDVHHRCFGGLIAGRRCLVRLTRQLWVFITLGVLQIVTGFLLAVVYFSIRALTTSLQYVEVIPTYANAILLLCNGILVMFLCKRKDKLMVCTLVVISVVGWLMCSATLVLTVRKALTTVLRFTSCRYIEAHQNCNCYTGFDDTENSTLTMDSEEFVFHNTLSCTVIQENLRDFVYTLCALYSWGIIMSVLCSVMGALHLTCGAGDSKASDTYQMQPFQNQISTDGNIELGQLTGTEHAPAEGGDNSPFSTRNTLDRVSTISDQRISRHIALPGQQGLHLLGVRRNESMIRPSDENCLNFNPSNEDILCCLQNVQNVCQCRELDCGQFVCQCGALNDNQCGCGHCGSGQCSSVQLDNRVNERIISEASQILTQNPLNSVENSRPAVRPLLHRHTCSLASHELPCQPQHRRLCSTELLSEETLHRGSHHHSVPSRPLMRQGSEMEALPPQPVRRTGLHHNGGRQFVYQQNTTSLPANRGMSGQVEMHFIGSVPVPFVAELPPPYYLPPPYVETDPDPHYGAASYSSSAPQYGAALYSSTSPFAEDAAYSPAHTERVRSDGAIPETII